METSRRTFLAGVGALVGAQALPRVSEPVKQLPALLEIDGESVGWSYPVTVFRIGATEDRPWNTLAFWDGVIANFDRDLRDNPNSSGALVGRYLNRTVDEEISHKIVSMKVYSYEIRVKHHVVIIQFDLFDTDAARAMIRSAELDCFHAVPVVVPYDAIPGAHALLRIDLELPYKSS